VEKGGLLAALKDAGLTQRHRIKEVDEMRLGLQSRVRRIWASRGVKVVQKVQFVFEWAYLLLGVNPLTGELHWDWMESMRQEHLVPVLGQWDLEGVIWDRASSHRGKQTAALPLKCIFQPPYSPELNPVERVFEELRSGVEGRIYPTLAAKQQAVENILQELAADPARVKRLVGWNWICEALESLPP
jgi:transposase